MELVIGLVVVCIALIGVAAWVLVNARREREGLDALREMVEGTRESERKRGDRP